MQNFGKRIRELRRSAGMTQQQLAERIWVSKAAISNYELYDRSPSPEILIKIAKVFHVSTDYLLGVEEEETPVLKLNDLTDEDIQILEDVAALLRKKNIAHSYAKRKKQEQEH